MGLLDDIDNYDVGLGKTLGGNGEGGGTYEGHRK